MVSVVLFFTKQNQTQKIKHQASKKKTDFFKDSSKHQKNTNEKKPQDLYEIII